MRSLLAVLLLASAAFADATADVQKIDQLQSTRDRPEALKQLDAAVTEAIKAHPDSYEIAWRAARHYVWVANTAPDNELKKVAAKKAWDFGDKARQLKPDGADGQFFAAAGVGLYGQAMGIMTAITAGVDGKFNERLDKAIQLDPNVDRGGPWMARGRYFYEVPWFMRDLKKSAAFYKKVLDAHPENLRAHYYLADTLLKDGKAKEAKAEIDKVISGDEAYDPPEARLVKKQAQRTLAEITEALK